VTLGLSPFVVNVPRIVITVKVRCTIILITLLLINNTKPVVILTIKVIAVIL